MNVLRDYRPEDREQIYRTYRLCFATDDEGIDGWFALAGTDSLRLLSEDGAPVASLLDIPMGHAVGGRWVGSHGVAGVAVAPENRGRGRARRMMATYLRELHGKGVALSSLFASTRGLYRGVGYEDAGLTFRYTVDLRSAARRAPLPLEPLADAAELRRAWREHAVRWHGVLDRGDYVWKRILERSGHETLVVRGPTGVEGWVVVKLSSDEDHWVQLHVADLVALTREAADTLLAFLGGYGSISTSAIFVGGPTHPVVDRMAERRWSAKVQEPWLARVVHLPLALTGRGWRSAEGRLDLDVEDEIVPANAGRWRLEVAGGTATVERGGTGALKVGSRGLGPLYFGHRSAHQLAVTGEVTGDAATLELASRLFLEAQPWLSHLF